VLFPTNENRWVALLAGLRNHKGFMADKISKARRSANMRNIRAKNTAPELTVRRLVHGLGFRYRLHSAKLPGKPDIVLSRSKKIVEVRGCFWHQHKGCVDSHLPKSRRDYWVPKLAKNIQRDKANERKLRKSGWDVLTIWECELRDTERLRTRIIAFLNAH
jgi:DNA mismatch endonuclease (patch repair protein)